MESDNQISIQALMSSLHRLYRDNLSLLTDLYQLTMAYGYWKTGMASREAVFHLYFRKHPFKGSHTIAAGLEQALAYVDQFQFTGEDLDYLATMEGNDGQPLFSGAFLEYLSSYRLSCDIAAIPEGTVVYPDEPLMRIRGPLIDCQLLETPLLNILNFQTLIATKASRVVAAAQGDPVVEFGLRRAQGPDGSLSASRAGYIGGCVATSNVLAGKLYGIPVKGTHAHAWVMAFPTEKQAFMEYARALPNNCIFLVDTYDTIQGVKHAIEAMKFLREIGHKPGGIRLDSGDLAALSISARALLDEAGFADASIIASNDLDEYRIAELKSQGAKIGIWGVGTNLVTAADQPALGGVYKLGAIKDEMGNWQYRVKLSGDVVKVTTPGILQVRRFHNEKEIAGDLIYDENIGLQELPAHLLTAQKSEDLLVEVVQAGEVVYANPPIAEIQKHCRSQIARLPAESLRPVLEGQLMKRKLSLIQSAQDHA